MYHSFTRIKKEIRKINKSTKKDVQQRNVLRELDCFVLDNSIRETTVSQLKGHTLEDKWKIYQHVKKCGFQYIVVAAFSDHVRVDDVFVRQLIESGEDMSKLFSFVDFIEKNKEGNIEKETIPVTLQKMKESGLYNPIIEIDLADKLLGKLSITTICQLLLERIEWTKKNLSYESKIFVNFRDFPIAMTNYPSRVLKVVKFLGFMKESRRPIGVMYEDATGKFMPEEIAIWTQSVRKIMNSVGWKSGHLLVHIHQNWGLAEAVQLECLKAGANGVWASVCEEGAAFGHACSSVTLMNLVRVGNKKVLDKFNCTYLRQAAIEVTKITTGTPPHPKQCLYGDRALDLCFDLVGIAGGNFTHKDFDMASFFCIDKPVRVSTLTSNDLLLRHMRKIFGHNPDFTEERVTMMKQKIVDDLIGNRKEEYMSPVGLALLFDRAGGHLNAKMRDVIENWEIDTPQAKIFIRQLRVIWDELYRNEEVEQQGDDALEFETFFDGFMQPYFENFKCSQTRMAMKALDMDNDGKVEWSEFLVYIKWAIYQYPDINDFDELLSVAFQKGLIPSMLDEILTPLIDFTNKMLKGTD